MASEDTVPLMEEVKEQSNIEEQDESIAVTQAPVKKRAFIFQRVTYYCKLSFTLIIKWTNRYDYIYRDSRCLPVLASNALHCDVCSLCC